MAGAGGSAPPFFADTEKFDGTNWVAWSGLIRIAAEVRGVYGYLEGTIPKPSGTPAITITPPGASTSTTATTPKSTTTTTIQPPGKTAWDSLNPSEAEWKVRNAWAKGLLIYNTKKSHRPRNKRQWHGS